LRIIASALRTLFTAEQRLIAAGATLDRQLLVQANAYGRQLQSKVLGTFVLVFFTVLVRSAFSVLYATAQALQNNSDPCSPSYCDPCKNVYSNMHGWILYTPWLQQVVMIIASPLALFVALWGMSGVRALEQMADQRQILQVEATRQQSSSAGGTASYMARGTESEMMTSGTENQIHL